MSTKKTDCKTLKPNSFEDALRELESIASQLEGGQPSLDESISLLARGRFLYDYCTATLEEAHIAINNIVVDDSGSPIDKTPSSIQRFTQFKDKVN